MGVRTVRISQEAHSRLGRLKDETGRSMTDLLDDSVARLEDALVIERMNEGYAALRADESAWAEERAEREGWDATLADHLD